MTRRLFGTDGVRGTAGTYPLDHTTVRRIGAALVRALPARQPRVCSSGATRVSRASGSSASSRTAPARAARRSPAPASFRRRAWRTSTRADDFNAGVVISASHNPFEDNGIKVFSGARRKVQRGARAHVEAIVADRSWEVPPATADAPVERADVVDATSSTCAPSLPDPRALGGSRVASIAPTARRPRSRRGCSASSASSHVHRRCAGRPEHQPGLRVHASRAARARGRRAAAARSASPSTATATARSSSTSAAGSSTATPSC